MYSGHVRARGSGYYNAPDFYSNICRIITHRFPAPYNVPHGLAGIPRAAALAAALGAHPSPQTVPPAAAPVAVVGRGKGRKGTPSNASISLTVTNVPKQVGKEHTCYKLKCGKSYLAGFGDLCPHCGTNQEIHEAGLLKQVNFKKSPKINLN